MLTLSGIGKSFGGRNLFAEVFLQINRRDKIGVVGSNGAGKSTLFSIILRTEAPDEGNLIMERAATVGWLPQETAPAGEETVLDLATASTAEAAERNQSLKGCSPFFPSAERPDEIPASTDRFMEAKAKKILKGLGFRDADFYRSAREMSGGWVMRSHLARLLVQEPDLLLLDEPTNHLDLEALLWFQAYLKTYPGAFLLISHDREFLNQLAQHIVELRQGKLTRYRGDYDEYLKQREAAETQQMAAWKNQEREIARLMEFVDRFRAKNTKASQAQSKLKQIERMKKIPAPAGVEMKVNFAFPQPPRSGLKVISLKGVDHAYGDQVVYRSLEFQAERGQRTVLVGPNGAGKSTLLKLLAGILPIQTGERALGHSVRLGYYSQNRVDMLQPGRTVLEETLDTPQRLTEEFVRTVLGCFLFRGDDVFKRVRVLSGGEKSRLALVKLLVDPPNLLLMDEPTTHLDLASVDSLLTALAPFTGTLIFISHDVYFIRSLANHVVHVESGRLRHFPGNYQYYLDKTASERSALETSDAIAQEKGQGPVSTPSDSRDLRRLEAERRNARSRARKEQLQAVSRLESEITQLEARQAQLHAARELPETYQQPGQASQINRELGEIKNRLDGRTAAWEKEATKLAEMDRRRA